MAKTNNILKPLIVLSLSFIIASCSKLTQTNFQHIKPNMTMSEVIAILGEPTYSERTTIAGISGLSAIWKDKQTEIDIQFLNDKVAVKSFSKLGKEEETL